MSKIRNLSLVLLLSLVGLTNSLATIPVIDVSAVPQWIMQAANMFKQLAEQVKQYEQLVAQLKQLETTYKAQSGKRNFEGYLMSNSREAAYTYLPEEMDILHQGGDLFGKMKDLGTRIKKSESEVTTLTKKNFGGDMNSPSAKMWLKRVEHLAMMRETTNAASRASSDRVATTKGLIDAIGMTDDPKSIAEVQARIAGEQARLANEEARLYVLAMGHRSDEEILNAMQSDMLVNMDKKPIPKVTYGKK